MREMKFRIWDSLKKEMFFEGFHVFGEVTLFNAIGTHAYETRGERTSLERYNDFEIMQYIDLKDKNGKDIYEGDIINVDQDENFRIEYFSDNTAFVGTGVQTGKVRWFEIRERFKSDFQINLSTSEIIGNIYENPELIK